ncbi:hypothetical protein E8E12_004693 [Didymella heteroderae]|uniref:Uncharacterized protein n=1 Tax=Didymella heteroderae TaxID=1769908 RepID=A0A9P4WM77_9PLEO|nr:hypothetical protein E8E12_004693 [Didymella heteroderae]
MALQRLNIRAKKSFPGLYSFDNMESSPHKSIAVQIESSPCSDLTQATEQCDLDDFESKLERCKGRDSPGKDSLSKRKRLFGSLRSLRTLANLHSSPTKAKQPTTTRSGSPVKRQVKDVCMTPLPISPSLALLDFEQSPSDQPMFDLTMHQRSVSGSSLEVHHSSPMTVPGSARQATPYNVFLPMNDFPAGTVPDTPGPMQRAFNRDLANYAPWQNADPTPVERYTPSTPVLTPLPGTNLSVGDIDPELVPLPPSVNPSMVHLGRSMPGYFDIPVDGHPQMDHADVLNGLACLKLADGHADTSGDHGKSLTDTATNAPIGRRGTAEEMRHQHEDARLQDTVNTLGIPQDQIQAYQRQQQAGELQEHVCGLSVPERHQVSPLRPKQQADDLHDSIRKVSCNSEGWEMCSGERSAAMASEYSLYNRDPNQTHSPSPASVYSAAPPSEHRKGADHGNDAPPKFAHVVWDGPRGHREAPAPMKTWDGHTGLYDGTGYGDDSGLSTPCEPDEGIHDIHLKASSAPLSVSGARSGNEKSNRPLRGEDPYHETVRQSPFSTCGHDNCESLESICRAYAYPLGDRISSSSYNGAGGDVQRPATKDNKISS